ncbi:hypothetical protein A2U01_0056443, partial [Trifolium medium]|nr:hypothetical protein [Trifolium medium]
RDKRRIGGTFWVFEGGAGNAKLDCGDCGRFVRGCGGGGGRIGGKFLREVWRGA